jgi:hypothetical protein
MGAIFFSSRHGYDEPPNFIQENDDEPGGDSDAPER